MEDKDKTKIATKEWYVCGTCEEKMSDIAMGGSSTDLFGFSSKASKAMYCDNKKCDKFGYLTVVGIKITE